MQQLPWLTTPGVATPLYAVLTFFLATANLSQRPHQHRSQKRTLLTMDDLNNNDGLSPTAVAAPAESPPRHEGTANAQSTEGPRQRPSHAAYTGYTPKSAADFEAAPLLRRDGNPLSPWKFEPDATLALDQARTNPVVLSFFAFFALAFLLSVFITGFSLDCKLNLCNRIDRSSALFTSYIYTVFEFIAPLSIVWIAFSAGLLGLFVASLMLAYHIRRPVGPPPVQHLTALTRVAVRAFQLRQARTIVVPLLVLFILVGFGANWRTAVCVLLGTLAIALTTRLCTVVTTRATTRAIAAAAHDLQTGWRISLRAAAVIGVGANAIVLAMLAVAYLIVQDVRALAGFVLGACLVALYSRQTGGTYASAARASTIGAVVPGLRPEDYVHVPRSAAHPATIADGVGGHVGTVAASSAGLLSSLVAAISLTAITGASLPFFHGSSYAMCVFNHLDVDHACWAYRAPTVKASLAVSLCRAGDFHTQYPVLTTWESNSAFVVLPFLVGIMGLMATIVSFSFFYVPKAAALDDTESRDKATRSLLSALRLHAVVAAVLVVIASAGVCWGMFGSNSAYYSEITETVEKFNLPPLNRSNINSICRPVDTPQGQGRTEIPFLFKTSGLYRPFDAFGDPYAPPSEAAPRLFGCILLGLGAGLILGAITEYFTLVEYHPTRRVVARADFGADAALMDGVGVAMSSTGAPLAVIIGTLFGANRMFGIYGIGLASVGMLSMTGMSIGMDAYATVVENVASIVEIADMTGVVRTTAMELQHVGTSAVANARGLSVGSAMITAHALMTVMIQDAGLASSSRQLVGSETISPTRHISDTDPLNLLNILVLIAMFVGLGLPFLFTFLSSFSAGNASVAVAVESAWQLNEDGNVREATHGSKKENGDVDEATHGVKPGYEHCVETSNRETFLYSGVPVFAAIMAPLIVGFSFGQRALVGMVVGTIGTGFSGAVSLMVAGGALQNGANFVKWSKLGKKFPGTRRTAVLVADIMVLPLRSVSMEFLSTFMKLVATVGIITIPLMEIDGRKWWIGLILFFITMVIISMFLELSDRQLEASWEELGKLKKSDKERKKGRMNKTYMSPFYEKGPSLAREAISPRSQLGLARTSPEHAAALADIVKRHINRSESGSGGVKAHENTKLE